MSTDPDPRPSSEAAPAAPSAVSPLITVGEGQPSVGQCSCGARIGASDVTARGMLTVALWARWIDRRRPDGRIGSVAVDLVRAMALREQAEHFGLCLPCFAARRGGDEPALLIWQRVRDEQVSLLCHAHGLQGAAQLALALADQAAEPSYARDLRISAARLLEDALTADTHTPHPMPPAEEASAASEGPE
ncbi:MAG: hypothetical protein U1A78_33535 [Polyangia bacterium]